MFPDSDIASKFSCGETKSSYLIRYGIGPYMKTLLQQRVREDDYVLLFDESLNREMQKKQLDILVRLWDNDCIQSRFFHSQFLGHASAHNLVEACIESVSVLNVRNIVQISMDGPNVNWSLYNKFENIIQDQCSKTLLPTGSCGLHQINHRVIGILTATSYHCIIYSMIRQREERTMNKPWLNSVIVTEKVLRCILWSIVPTDGQKIALSPNAPWILILHWGNMSAKPKNEDNM